MYLGFACAYREEGRDRSWGHLSDLHFNRIEAFAEKLDGHGLRRTTAELTPLRTRGYGWVRVNT